MRGIGALEIGLIVLGIVLIFGIGKLGQVGGALGKSIREFRREKNRKDDDGAVPALAEAGAADGKGPARAAKGKFCPGCGSKVEANARFCMECGAKMGDDS